MNGKEGQKMFTFEYCFYPKTMEETEIDDFDESMQWFLASLAKNGQILLDFQNTVKLDSCYACRVVAPEMDSLNQKYWNLYCKKFYKEIMEQSRQKPTLSLIGENYDVPDCCSCRNTSHFILMPEYGITTTPVLCGDCLQGVPLYRLPKTYYKEEYYDLINWYRVYKSCDRLFMLGTGERFGYRMMHNPKSSLSKEGRQFCRFFEEETGIPFYYFLFQYYSKNKKNCPLCGENWVNPEPEKIQFDFVCSHCRLVSDDI